jgi:Tfp pilus assembly protein PilV
MCRELSILYRVSSNGLVPAKRSEAGFTIVEAMVAASVTVVIAIGSLSYQYYSIKHSRASQSQVMATRIGQLLLEDWKSTNADDTYDPTSLGLGFLSPEPGEDGQYLITFDNQTFFLQLNHNDVAYDSVANVTLRQINVTVRWRTDYARGPVTGDDPFISLTTYVRCDGT